MKNTGILPILLLLSFLARSSSAAAISYSGTLVDPNEVFLQTITVSQPSSLSIQTLGFGGTASSPSGTNAAMVLLPAGGFDPVVALFDPGGVFLDQNDDGFCPPGTLDEGNCFDSSLLFTFLAPGTYTLALTVVGNFSAGAILADGFTGGGDFAGRSGFFAVDVDLRRISQEIPEPATSLLILAGMILCLWIRRR